MSGITQEKSKAKRKQKASNKNSAKQEPDKGEKVKKNIKDKLKALKESSAKQNETNNIAKIKKEEGKAKDKNQAKQTEKNVKKANNAKDAKNTKEAKKSKQQELEIVEDKDSVEENNEQQSTEKQNNDVAEAELDNDSAAADETVAEDGPLSEEESERLSSLTEEDIVKVLEAALFTAGKPMSAKQLWRLFPRNEHMTIKRVKESLVLLAEIYQERGVILKEVASGFRFEVAEQTFPWLEKLYEEKPAKYSRALMETLSLIAYRQPITRGEIEEVRGVSVSTNIIHTLLEHEWIKAVGHREVPGRPALYATTNNFLDYFGLKSISQLPELPEIDLEAAAQNLEQVENALNPQASMEEEAENMATDDTKNKPQLEFAANDPNQAEKQGLKRDKLDQIIMTAPSDKLEPEDDKAKLDDSKGSEDIKHK